MKTRRIKSIMKPLYKNLRGKFLMPEDLDASGKGMDELVGRSVQLPFGVGKVHKTRRGRFSVQVRIKCESHGCRSTKTVYARPAAPGGWCYVYNRRGQFMADMRDQCYICPSCKKRGVRT